MMDSTPIQFRYEEVEQLILGMMDEGTLHPGDKLPSLRNMASRLGMSVTTVSQAYAELEFRGMVEARPRSGYYVRTGFRSLPPVQDTRQDVLESRIINKSDLILDVLENMSRKNMVHLGVAHTSSKLLPVHVLNRIMSQVIREEGAGIIQYANICGDEEYRRQIAFRGMDSGMSLAPSDIIATNGCMEALYLSLRVLTKPGDNVLIQTPTYFCFLHLMESLGLRAIEVPSHPETGVDMDELRTAVQRFSVQACVLTPNFNNPDGSQMPEDAIQDVVRFLADKDVPLVEDDVYGDICDNGPRGRTAKSFDRTGSVLLCSSFSKTLAPGYRAGYMLPGRFYKKALDIHATTNVCCVTPTQRTVAEFLRQGKYDAHLKKLRRVLSKQKEKMRAHVASCFPAGTQCTSPRGGTELWLQLPQQVDGVQLFMAARSKGVGICPGAVFSTQEKYHNYIRISCGQMWGDSVVRAVQVLGDIASEMAAYPAPAQRR